MNSKCTIVLSLHLKNWLDFKGEKLEFSWNLAKKKGKMHAPNTHTHTHTIQLMGVNLPNFLVIYFDNRIDSNTTFHMNIWFCILYHVLEMTSFSYYNSQL